MRFLAGALYQIYYFPAGFRVPWVGRDFLLSQRPKRYIIPALGSQAAIRVIFGENNQHGTLKGNEEHRTAKLVCQSPQTRDIYWYGFDRVFATQRMRWKYSAGSVFRACSVASTFSRAFEV